MKSSILELIKESNSIALFTHESPDGDAVGSMMAFYYMLRSMNKTVDIIMPDVPKSFVYLNSINRIVDKGKESYDLAILLDCASKKRIGQIDNIFEKCKKSIAIDHHASNPLFCDLNYVEPETAACCQVIYYLFKDWKIDIDKNIGEALTTGLLTDTTGFKNNNVDKNSFLMAAEMLDLGINIYDLYKL